MFKKVVFFGFIIAVSLAFVGCATMLPNGLKGLNFTTAGDFVTMESSPEYYFENGPAKHLMTNEDRKIWKKIKKIPDLQKRTQTQKNFLSWFWKVRDPDKSTPVNEYKVTFYQYAAFAKKNFRQGYHGSGWDSDRGKIFLILGPADWEFSDSSCMLQREYEEKYLAEQGEHLWWDKRMTDELLFWQYNRIDYLPEVMPNFQFQTGPFTISFRQSFSGGWQIGIRTMTFGYGEVVIPTHRHPEYITGLERLFERLRKAYIKDKNAKFVF